jgi:hypothetical protein
MPRSGCWLVAQRFEDLLRENNAPIEKRRVRVASCPRWSRFEFGLGDQSQVARGGL